MLQYLICCVITSHKYSYILLCYIALFSGGIAQQNRRRIVHNEGKYVVNQIMNEFDLILSNKFVRNKRWTSKRL